MNGLMDGWMDGSIDRLIDMIDLIWLRHHYPRQWWALCNHCLRLIQGNKLWTDLGHISDPEMFHLFQALIGPGTNGMPQRLILDPISCTFRPFDLALPQVRGKPSWIDKGFYTGSTAQLLQRTRDHRAAFIGEYAR